MSKIVEVEVQKVRSAGIEVKILDDDRPGFIRRRELTWNRSVRVPPPKIEPGQRRRAKVLYEGKDGQVFLSLRQVTDPWEWAKDKYYEGQLVQGEIVHIRSFGAFVQIEPGIDAILRPKGLPLSPGQLIDEILSVGDYVQGLITRFDIKNQKIAISVKDWLEELSRLDPKARRDFQIKLFKDKFRFSESDGSQAQLTTLTEDINRRYCPPIQPPDAVLVVDDEENNLTEIQEHLEAQFDFEVEGVSNGQKALERFQLSKQNDKHKQYNLVVMDIMLAYEDGVQIAEKLRDIKLDLAIVYTSADPTAADRIPNLDDARTVFAPKDVDEIANRIEDFCHGYWETTQGSETTVYTGLRNFIHQLGMTAFTQRSLSDTLRSILSQLRQETQVSHCMVLKVDSQNKDVSILASVPPLEDEILKTSLDALYYSPVQDVVDYGQEYYETDIAPKHNRRFKNFFRTLSFRSCLGIPLRLPDLSSTRHALFLLDRKKELNPTVITYASLVSEPLKVALERSLLLDYMTRYEQRYTMGQLIGSLVHELSNKIGGLKNNVETLPTLLNEFSAAQKTDAKTGLWDEIIETAQDLNQDKEELLHLIEAYSRLAKGELEEVDVNDVVKKVIRQLKTKSQELGVRIYQDQETGLPRVRAVQTHLEQIIINLVLNAIQQVGLQRKTMKKIAKQRGKDIPLLQKGQVLVQTRYIDSHIQIRVIDTGPGIHYHQQDCLFLIDDTTREKGHGLGLFISRNLVETIGGNIRFVDSMMFIGSAFVIELPILK
jgi:signal transduction histidine kinase/predicted RNA-binding protein with RPS1 domain